MPSNAVQSAGDGKVRCRMVNDEIPAHVCHDEQGATECEGCSAPTRRCTACGKARGIVDAERGLCELCSKSDGGFKLCSIVFEGTPEKVLDTVLGRVRAVGGSLLPASDQLAHDKQWTGSAAELNPSPLVQNPVALYRVLMEHGNERDGIWKVNAPIAILMRRFHLLRQEATSALSALIEKSYLSGEAPWSEVVLTKTEGIEEIRAKIDHPWADVTKRTNMRRGGASAKAIAASAATSVPRPSAQAKPSVDAAVSGIAELPSMRPLATYGEIQAHLISRSHEVHSERLVGGAVPALQIRFKLSAVQAMESLEWLRANNHIQQKDGWRTVVLLSDKIESTEGPARLETPGRSNAHRGGWGKSVVPQCQSITTEATGQTAAAASEPTTRVKTAEVPRTIEVAIAEFERALPPLRKQRDDLAQHVAQLEATHMALKAMRGQLKQTQQATDNSLADALRAVQTLFSFLRR